ncbi:histidine phosphatase family protein [Baekduia sp.]|jgi:broad specificity phosphatase PhoE|uniref:histidine phosphatase family protein n=1 Tax=Baekduia sp. TaxID=2600305 RepID=UPI002DF89B0C|nr:histidine phosphatase family protein [Baekduia sp.]
MPSILLVRHGQASYGADDYDVLSETGWRQAEVLAAEHARRGLRFDVVVSGGLQRQRGTAEVLARAGGTPVEIDPGWNEYDADDVLTHHAQTAVRLDAEPGTAGPSVSSRDFQALLDGALIAWIEAGDAGGAREAWPAFDARVRGAPERLVARLGSGETALVCSSGGVIGAVCAALMGMAPTGLVVFNRVAINTGVARLVSGRQGVTLVSFNEHGHLDGLEPSLRTYR